MTPSIENLVNTNKIYAAYIYRGDMDPLQQYTQLE